jgi:hypothetical protein
MSEDEFFDEIAPTVLPVLKGRGFFERLDDWMCPTDTSRKPEACQHSYLISTKVLVDCDFSSEDIAEILKVLSSRGGCCDCEILFNVAEQSRLKSQYWKYRAQALASQI